MTKSHGMSKTATYRSYAKMKSRCASLDPHYFPYYRGRGITVCPEWHTFEAFLADMGERPGPGFSIERLDGHFGYSKANCKWATMIEQQNNKSSNVILTAFGRSQTIAQWARELGINVYRIRMRVRRGELHERALSQVDDQFVQGSRATHKAHRSLTDEQVTYIRLSTWKNGALGRLFHVSTDLIRNVRNLKTYKDVK